MSKLCHFKGQLQTKQNFNCEKLSNVRCKCFLCCWPTKETQVYCPSIECALCVVPLINWNFTIIYWFRVEFKAIRSISIYIYSAKALNRFINVLNAINYSNTIKIEGIARVHRMRSPRLAWATNKFQLFSFFLGLQFSIIAFSKFSMCLFICVLYYTVKNDICWPTLAVNVQCNCEFRLAHLKLKLNANATTSPFKIISFTNYMTRPRRRGHVKSHHTGSQDNTWTEPNRTERNGTD